MASTFLFALFLATTAQSAVGPGQVVVAAQFLNRPDLPSDIDFQLLGLGYAVLRLRIDNQGDEAWTVRPAEVLVRDPKGKTLRPASLDEVTPKIMKHGRTSRGVGLGAEIGIRNPDGYPGAYPGRYPTGPRTSYPGVYQPPVPGNAPAGTVKVGEAQRIRAILEQHQLAQTTIEPGDSLEALVYIKSKKTASELTGSHLSIASLPAIEIK